MKWSKSVGLLHTWYNHNILRTGQEASGAEEGVRGGGTREVVHTEDGEPSLSQEGSGF